MKIGIEYEGVLLKNNKPTRFMDMDWKIRNKIREEYFDEHPCDNCDYLIEVRTQPWFSEKLLLNEFYYKKNLIEKLLKKYGYSVSWKEMKIPKGIPDLKKENKTQHIFDENGCRELEIKNNNYRGGGLHINFNSDHNWYMLFKMYLKTKYANIKYKFKSQYRQGLIFRKHDFGYELISIGWKFSGKRDKEFDKLITKLFN